MLTTCSLIEELSAERQRGGTVEQRARLQVGCVREPGVWLSLYSCIHACQCEYVCVCVCRPGIRHVVGTYICVSPHMVNHYMLM